MVARGCQGSPEVPVDLKRGLQTAPGPGEAARGQFRPKLTIRAAAPCLKISTRNRTSPGLGSYAGVMEARTQESSHWKCEVLAPEGSNLANRGERLG